MNDREQLLDDVAVVAVAIQQTTMTLHPKDEIHAAFQRILELVPQEYRLPQTEHLLPEESDG